MIYKSKGRISTIAKEFKSLAEPTQKVVHKGVEYHE